MSDDSLEPLVTQCPNCNTRFRVSEAQLQVAAGRVRCGACLAVFEGTAHLSVDGEEMVAQEGSDVDALLEELDDINAAEPAKLTSLPAIGKGDLVPVSATELAARSGTVESFPPELLALEAELLAQMEAGTPASGEVTAPATGAEPASPGNDGSAAVDADSVGDDETAAIPNLEVEGNAMPDAAINDDTATPQPADDDTGTAADNLWLDEVAADLWQDSAASPTVESSGSAASASMAEPDAGDTEAIELEALPAPQDTQPATDAATAAPADEYDYRDDPEPEPPRSWLTRTLIVVALIGLPAQVLWFQYETWVKDPNFRPLYQVICDAAGCELPPLRDVSKIASKRSFIRAHPDRADARIVDVLMVNNADFAQPYPLIELVATTVRGQLVAGRRFTPAEYLQGAANTTDLLAPKTPVHVSLEIEDPGEEALNFEVRFR